MRERAANFCLQLLTKNFESRRLSVTRRMAIYISKNGQKWASFLYTADAMFLKIPFTAATRTIKF